MPEEQPPPVPALPQYLTAHHFAQKKQAGPLTKMLNRMLKPKTHRLMKTSLKKQKKKHQVQFY
jgi:hypothetical protein